MRFLVTGVAGFIGSHLAESLLADGEEVVGIDSLTSYYDLGQKRSNLSRLEGYRTFRFLELDLRAAPVEEYMNGCEVVFHQSAQPGVRASWGTFQSYVEHNIYVTHRLLEAARAVELQRFVYASSSSVYGNAPTYPTREEDALKPHSPYGVTKLAGEQLVTLFGENWGLPTVALRYFTVFGPGQRPDMAIYRLIDSALHGRRFPLFGDGTQIRDFTYVEDVVRANLLCLSEGVRPGTVLNIAGGGSTSMNSLIELVEDRVGGKVVLDRFPLKEGDVRETGGSIVAAEKVLGWTPVWSLVDGVAEQVEWQRGRNQGSGVVASRPS